MADISAVKDITAKLETGVKELFESDKYAAYLQTMSRFHRYSTRNTLLIHMQMPTATRVAGYNDWKNNFKRQVKKGEHGIKIFAPIPFVKTQEMDKLDPETQRPIIGDDGLPVRDEVEIRMARFKVVPVFDVSQTEGEPLPVLIETLTGDVARYELFMDALRAVSPLPVAFENLPPGTDGTCHFGDKISIRNGMSEIQTVSAVIHEIAHAKLHDQQVVNENGGDPKDRRTEEVEAESVSYAVCQYYGIETGANSFGYLAEWSRGRELKELNASLDTIRKAAAELIDGIDEKYRTLAKERNVDLTATVPDLERIAETSAPSEPVKIEMPQEKGASMEYSDLQQKGFEIAKRYENLPLQDRLNIIASTFGCKTARVETVLCTGKYRGYSDICLTLDNGANLGIGMERTPQAKSPKVISQCVNDTLARYNPEIVGELKARAAAALSIREAEDNTVAAQRGLKSYTFLNVELCDGFDRRSGGHLGWYYVTLAVEGKIFGFVETGLYYDIARGVLSERITRPNYFVAGGLRDTDADFVFNNVGHSSFNGSHQLALDDNARERAEKRLSERISAKTEVEDTMEHTLYEKFTALFPDFASGKYSYMRLESDGFEPLSLEWVFGDRISLMHTYELNGDLCYDPMMEFRFDNIGKTMSPCTFEQSIPPLYQYFNDKGIGISTDGNGRERTVTALQQELNSFASGWLDNIAEQGYVPVKANLVIGEDNEVRVTFDNDGNPIMPEPEIAEPDIPMPDPAIGFSEMNLYGYEGGEMLPMMQDRAAELFDSGHCVYLLYTDNTESMALDRSEILNHDGIFGIELGDWEKSPLFAAQMAAAASTQGSREADLLYGGESKFGIYQIKDSIDEARNFRFASMRELEAMGLTADRANYELVYTGKLDIRDTQANLNKIYEDFNMNHPADYTSPSVSVSDVIVLQQRGEVSAHFVDSVGFKELPVFTGNERKPPQTVEQTVPALSQLGNRSAPAEMVNAERRPPLSKGKPSLLDKLEQNKQRAARQGQPEAHKNNALEV